MTIERAIEVLKHTTGNINWDANREEIYFTDEWVQAYEMAIAALREQDVTDIYVGCKWISVTDKLPEYDRKVLVTDTRYGFISIAEQKAGGRVLADCWECEDGMRLSVSEITHWMYLPEPPKEDV